MLPPAKFVVATSLGADLDDRGDGLGEHPLAQHLADDELAVAEGDLGRSRRAAPSAPSRTIAGRRPRPSRRRPARRCRSRATSRLTRLVTVLIRVTTTLSPSSSGGAEGRARPGRRCRPSTPSSSSRSRDVERGDGASSSALAAPTLRVTRLGVTTSRARPPRSMSAPRLTERAAPAKRRPICCEGAGDGGRGDPVGLLVAVDARASSGRPNRTLIRVPSVTVVVEGRERPGRGRRARCPGRRGRHRRCRRGRSPAGTCRRPTGSRTWSSPRSATVVPATARATTRHEDGQQAALATEVVELEKHNTPNVEVPGSCVPASPDRIRPTITRR